MAEAPSANGPKEVATGTDKHGDATQQTARIDQFWDKNRLVMPWMETYLPNNRMWADGIATVVQLFMSFCIFAMIFHVIFKLDKIFTAICLSAFAYIFGSFNARMARAQRKFPLAKRNGGRNG